MEHQTIALIWAGLALLVAGIAWLKNRSVAKWFIYALLFSPLIIFLILIFLSGVEKYEYTGEGKVSKSSGGSGFLIGGIAVLFLIGIFYFAYQNEMPSTSSLQSLDAREDISKYTINGELAKAFNLNSKYTDIQRENLLKQIKGQLVIWEVEIYEIDKQSDKVYNIQTSGGLNIGASNVGTFIELTAKDTLQSNFIEGLKTGQVIRIKGILTGESTLRSLIIKPAILWYPDDKKTDVQKSEAPSFIDGLKNKGEIFSISSDLKIIIEKEEYVHIP